MEFKDLTPIQKKIFKHIEGYFMIETYAEAKDFVTALGVLINKWKRGLNSHTERKSHTINLEDRYKWKRK